MTGPKERTMLSESHGSFTHESCQQAKSQVLFDPAGNTATVNINATATATPTAAPESVAEATPTPIPNIWDAPSTSGWGLAALVAGMLVVMVIALGLTSGSRRAAKP